MESEGGVVSCNVGSRNPPVESGMDGGVMIDSLGSDEGVKAADDGGAGGGVDGGRIRGGYATDDSQRGSDRGPEEDDEEG